MRRLTRYTIALLTASVITGIAVFLDQSFSLLFGTFVIYALAIEVTLRYPNLVWNSEQQGGSATGVFAGGITIGLFSLIQAFDSYGALILGLGLILFSGSTVIWMVDNCEVGIQSTNSKDTDTVDESLP